MTAEKQLLKAAAPGDTPPLMCRIFGVSSAFYGKRAQSVACISGKPIHGQSGPSKQFQCNDLLQ